MAASARIERFQVRTGQGDVLDPFDLQGASGMYSFLVQIRAQRPRFKVVSSNGGNTGIVDLGVYTGEE